MRFGLVHGGCHSGSSWSLLEPELRALGHHPQVLDLPIEDQALGVADYAKAVAAAFAGSDPLVLVGHSVGAPTVLEVDAGGLLPLAGVVLLCAAIPYSSELAPDQPDGMLMIPPEASPLGPDGLVHMVPEAAGRYFYQDCPDDVVQYALSTLRGHAPAGMGGPSRLQRTSVPSAYIRAEDDAAVGATWSEWAARTLTGRPAVVIPGGHSPFLSRPAELARTLDALATTWG